MRLFLILLIFTLSIIIVKRGLQSGRISNFTNYKKITVTPQPIIYTNLQLHIPPNKPLYNNIATQLQKIFPIHTINNNTYDITNLELSNKKPNIISIIPGLCNYNSDFPNIRYISSIGIEMFTLFSHNKITSWNNLIGKTIATLSTQSASYIALYRLRKIFNMTFKIKILKKIDLKIVDAFKNEEYSAVFMVSSHPNNMIQSIHKQTTLTFIGTSGLNKDKLKLHFPDLHQGKLDLTYYNIYNNMPDTILSKMDIICNKNLTHESGYRFIKTIFENLLNIKTNGPDKYKLQMKDFNPEFIYLSNNLYKLHNGVKEFYKEIGLITNNNNRSCRYKAGIEKCAIKKLNHFMLL